MTAPRPWGPAVQGRRRRRSGLTLLETMVALVILGLVAVASLEVVGGTVRAAGNAEVWTRAVGYAEDQMELLKADTAAPRPLAVEALPGGFARRVETRPWREGLVLVRVVVELPGGGEYALERLAEVGP